MDKTEQPTRSRIDELRLEGRVAYSSFTTKAAVTLAVFWVIAWKFWYFGTFSERIVNLLGRVQSNEEFLRQCFELAEDVVLFFFTLAGAAASAALVIGVLQTRFMFRMKNISLNFERLNPFARAADRLGWPRSTIAALLIALVSSALLLAVVTPGIFKMLDGGPQDLAFSLQQILRLLGPAFSVTLTIFAFLSWLAARQAFARAHRMTRREIEEDGGSGS